MSEPQSQDSSATSGERMPHDHQVASTGLFGWWAGPLCLVLLAGLALPPGLGLVLPLAVSGVMVVVAVARVRRLSRVRTQLSSSSPAARRLLGLAGLSAVALLLTVLARGVGAVVVDQPAALWGVAAAIGVAIVWAVIGGRLPARARPPVLLVMALAIPLAGIQGARWEAAAQGARGWAHGGPVLGIHPFQITAILVDGEGPFDLPINDYVEPDGSRGYDPVALAEALDHALEVIADTNYADGPARMQRALRDAEVEAVVTEAVWERLDRPPNEEEQSRLRVRSGSFGRRSRIEFVCPGRRVDPRGAQGESVMNRMCPDKYAAEASAGLGVTGRWSGYAEGRGTPRLGLSRWTHDTLSDDDAGRRAEASEVRLWAFLLLGLTVVLAWPRAAAVGAGVRGVTGALGVLAVLGLVVGAVAGGGSLMVGAWPTQPLWNSWQGVAAWAPALALPGLAMFAIEGNGSASAGPSPMQRHTLAVAVPAILMVVTTVVLAATLPALGWIFPVQGPQGAQLPQFVLGVAEAVGERGGLTIFEVEGAVAATLAALLLGGLLGVSGAGLAIVRRTAPDHARLPTMVVAALVTVVVAAALVLSRKTAGGAALMPGVVGMTLVFGSGLARIPADGRWSVNSGVIHLLWTAMAGLLLWAAVDPLPPHSFVTLCTWLGAAVVAAAGVAPWLRSSSPETSRDDAA